MILIIYFSESKSHIAFIQIRYIYNARKHRFLSFKNFLNEVSKIKKLEKRVAWNNPNKSERFRKKWHRIENEVPYNLIRNKQKIKSTSYKPTEGGCYCEGDGGRSFFFIHFILLNRYMYVSMYIYIYIFVCIKLNMPFSLQMSKNLTQQRDI